MSQFYSRQAHTSGYELKCHKLSLNLKNEKLKASADILCSDTLDTDFLTPIYQKNTESIL